MTLLLTSLVTLTIITVNNAQQPYIGKVTHQQKAECSKQAQISPDKLELLRAVSTNCRDAYEDKENRNARCYHMCLQKKLGFYDNNNEFILDRLKQKFSFINEKEVESIINECLALNPYKHPCDTDYYMHKCFDKSAGNYPHGTKALSICNVTRDVEDGCRKSTGISSEQVCAAVSGTVVDQFEQDGKARCYHVCMLEKMGFVSGNKILYEAVQMRFFYIEADALKSLYDKCNKDFDESNKCDVIYGIHKCLKSGVGEYPVPADKL